MKKESLKIKVYKSLRLDIVSGKLTGGTRITETAIAQELNVSRTPVREALQKLAQEKFLLAIPKAGYIVEDLSDNEIQDLFTTRMEIEQIAIQKAIEHITVKELKVLDDNLEQTKACIKAREEFKITKLDIEFHTVIYKAARSKSLFRVCKNLSDLTIRYRHGLNLVPNLWTELLQQHIKIYQALISKNSRKTMEAIALHAQLEKSSLMDLMQKVRSDAFTKEDY
ncbi:MAG: GntR family transcriptional regulator [Desulfobacula sp.]|nr:GntR family transcriptional regulator [Desulfobacula sp.]